MPHLCKSVHIFEKVLRLKILQQSIGKDRLLYILFKKKTYLLVLSMLNKKGDRNCGLKKSVLDNLTILGHNDDIVCSKNFFSLC